jgi:uncharacterized protein (DUF924 family)
MVTANQVVEFWIDEVGSDGWYVGGVELDQKVTEGFVAAWWDTLKGGNALWLTYATGTLAYLILMDQMSRSMFRGTARAFGSDRQALAAAKSAIQHGWDLRIDEPARQFFYTPLMHSESLTDQDRAVRLIKNRLPNGEALLLPHARVHREIIRHFGRFPFRNEALERKSTALEIAYEAAGGYRLTLEELTEPITA